MDLTYVPKYNDIKYLSCDPAPFIHSLVHQKGFYFFSERPQSVRVVSDNTLYIFFKKESEFNSRSIFLFKSVKEAAVKFCNNHNIVVPEERPCNYTNRLYSRSDELVATDVNNAYWRIALNENIITPEVYQKGLEFKNTSLASLAVLGRDCNYSAYRGLEYLKDVTIGGRKDLKDLYKFIRFSCYETMYECSEELKEDFYKWKTDEVIYTKTDKHIEIVHAILSNKNLSFKDTPYSYETDNKLVCQ